MFFGYRASVAHLLVLALACCDGADEEPITGSASFPISGGELTGYKTWTGVIAIVDKRPGGYSRLRCTGTLVHPEIVLTAGHCVKLKGDILQPGYDNTVKPEHLVIESGAKVGVYGLAGEVIGQVKEAVVHDAWTGSPDPPNGIDLALLRLAEPIESEGTYCLRSKPWPVVGSLGVVVGYGLENDYDEFSAGFHRAAGTTIGEVTESYIVIGTTGNICSGDSGGPLFCEVEQDVWKIAGVTSYGVAACLPEGPSHMTNVDTYVDWINTWAKKWTGSGLSGCTRTGPGVSVDTDDSGSGTETSLDGETETESGSETATEPDTADTGAERSEPSGSPPNEGCDCGILSSSAGRWGLLSALARLLAGSCFDKV